MQDCAPVHTPLTVKEKLSSSQSPKMDDNRHKISSTFKGLNYLEGVDSLLYACRTCLDIAHTSSILAQFGANPGKPHYKVLKHILQYLKGIAHFSLTFGAPDNKTNLIG
jgi:hypothetical protein